jgi:Pyruvate/2-oxoacid:ferredoxin oxidoreductase delta subunit
MDAVVGMEGNGPSGGKPRTINRIIASEHGVAVDGVFAAMIGLDPERVGILRAARGRGLGAVDISDIDVEGKVPQIRRFKLPVNVVGEDLVSRISAPFMRRIGTPKFRLQKDVCTRCGTCAKGCPRAAITLDPFPVWNYERCIGCYCCYELCEQDAIRLAGLFSRAASRR